MHTGALRCIRGIAALATMRVRWRSFPGGPVPAPRRAGRGLSAPGRVTDDTAAGRGDGPSASSHRGGPGPHGPEQGRGGHAARTCSSADDRPVANLHRHRAGERPARTVCRCSRGGRSRAGLAISALRCWCVNELPSVALTQRFLTLCEHHGSKHLVVKLVAVGCGTGVPGCPKATTGRRGTRARCGPRSSIWSTCASDEPGSANLPADVLFVRDVTPNPLPERARWGRARATVRPRIGQQHA